MWGVFWLILVQGADNLTRTCRVTFALLAVFLFVLSLAHVTASVPLLHSAALVGFACSLPGLLGGVRQGWRELFDAMQPGTVRPAGCAADTMCSGLDSAGSNG